MVDKEEGDRIMRRRIEMNVSAQNSTLSTLRADRSRLLKEIDYELEKRFGRQAKVHKSVKQCFYCAEDISTAAKVCPKCKSVFLEYAIEVYQMEKKIIESSR